MAYIPSSSEPIAIIGSACRFPGHSTSPSRLWELLRNPYDLTKQVPEGRFNVDGFHHPDGEHHGTTNAPNGYWLEEDPRRFDSTFFNITPKEAEAIDPQGKVLLEAVYEGLESAGLTLEGCSGSQVGVYVGTMTADYDILTGKDELTFSQYCATGTSRAIISNRVSYFFHWNGPSMTIDTACSSSLVAMHQAVLGLRSGESTMACVAGANLMLSPEPFICESSLHMLSPDGKSKMWDQSADGYARGEGVGVVFLKTLSRALADGDHIECIVRETGVNSDGRTKGITMPSSLAQAALIQDTYRRSGLDALNPDHRCQYFEAHGTGTQAGDPTEAEAIYKAFFGEDEELQEDGSILVGSIKTIIGHTEGAAGVAGVLKAALALKHAQVPPNQHLKSMNPRVVPFTRRLHVPNTLIPWPSVRPGHPLRASVNSFGFGGTNSHAILESYVPAIHGGHLAASIEKPIEHPPGFPLVLSANSAEALKDKVEQYIELLESEPEIDLQDLAWTLATRRSELPYRVSFSPVAGRERLLQEMRERLQTTEGNSSLGVRSKTVNHERGRILGIFTGQGAQWPQMGQQLIQRSPRFKEVIQSLDAVLRSCPDPPAWSIAHELLAPPTSSRLSEAALSQPLCTAVQIALVDILHEAGVELAAAVGHSSGEIAAAYAAGILTAPDAILIAYYRGFHAGLAQGPEGCRGGMMAVGMGVNEALEFCEQPAFLHHLHIAASNSPASVTISGDLEPLKQAKALLDERGTFARLLKVDTAYHSHHMDRCAAPYLQSLQAANIAPLSLTRSCVWVSSVYGPSGAPTLRELSGRYWKDNMVQPVFFTEAVTRALTEEGPFDMALEIGPHPALQGPAVQTMQEVNGSALPYAGLLHRGRDDLASVISTMGLIWSLLGSSSIDFDALSVALGNERSDCRVVKDLPSYPWDHTHMYHRQPRMAKQYLNRPARPHELLGVRTSDDTESEWRWRNLLKPSTLPWLKDHRFQDQIIVPAAAYCVMAFEAARALTTKPVKLVEIQNLSIKRGITMSDDSQGVETIFMLRKEPTVPGEGVISASFILDFVPGDADAQGTNAVKGMVHLHLGEPSAETLPRRSLPPPSGLNRVDLDEFYGSIKDIGLGYTGPFRAMTSLQRRLDFATGTLPKPHPAETSTLPVAPSLLDACFQAAFAAYAAPGDGSLWTSFLPQEIQNIRFNLDLCPVNPGPAATVNVDAVITQFSSASPESPANFSGDICVFNANGNMEVQVEGLTVVALSSTGPANDCELFIETVYKPDPYTGIVEARTEGINEEYVALQRACMRIADHFLHPNRTAGKPQQTPEAMQTGLADSPFRGYLELLISCGRTAPSRLPTAITEILMHFNEQSALQSHIRASVSQISHRFPQLRVLEITLGELQKYVTDAVVAGLAAPFHSYSHLFETTEKDAPSLLSAQTSIQDSRFRLLAFDKTALLSEQFPDETFDLVILSDGNRKNATLTSQLDGVHQLLAPGGYVFCVHSTGIPLQDRLLNPQKHHQSLSLQTLLRATPRVQGDFDLISSWTSPLRTIALSIRQSMSADVRHLIMPLTATDVSYMSDTVLLIGGETGETAQLSYQLAAILRDKSLEVVTAPRLEDVVSTSMGTVKAVIVLSDLDKPVLSSVNSSEFTALKQILVPNMSVLWLTSGFRDDQPYHYGTVGLFRSIRTETPQLKLQILDVAHISGAETVIAECFLRLITYLDSESTPLWTSEPELVWDGQHLLIPRVLPIDDLNRRYNSTRRVVHNYQNASLQVVQVVARWNGDRYTHHAVEATPSKASAPADEHFVNLRVLYSSAWAIEIKKGFHAFVSVATDSASRHLLALSPTNSSLITIPATHVHALPATGLDLSALLNRIVATLLAQSLLRQASPGGLLVHEADSFFADTLQRLNDEVRLLCFSTTDLALDDNRFIRLHPLSTKDATKAAVPSSRISSVADFSLGLTPTALVGLKSSTCMLIKAMDSLVKTEASILDNGNALSTAQDALLVVRWVVETALEELGSTRKPHTTTRVSDVLDKGLQPLGAVLDWTENVHVPLRVNRFDPGSQMRGNKTYVMIGLTGELGQSLCQFMVSHGARHLVVASRNPDKSPAWKTDLEKQGATIQVLSVDVTNVDAVRQLRVDLETSMPPVGGIVNGAMVLSDGLFADMPVESLQKALAPKVLGSQNLHDVFSDVDLDFFVMFSSLTGVPGNQGQSNYTAANMFMAGLAAQRRKAGQAASVLDIGMVSGIGYINRTDGAKIYANLKRQGYMPISERDIHGMFIEAIHCGRPTSTTGAQLTTGLQRFGVEGEEPLYWHTDPRFSHHRVLRNAVHKSTVSSSVESLKSRISEVQSQTAIAAILTESFASHVEAMLHLDPGSLDKETAIINLGVDSLMAVEIRSWFLAEVEKDMPVLKVLGGSSVATLAEEVAKELFEDRSTSAPPPMDLDKNSFDLGSVHGSSTDPSSNSDSKSGFDGFSSDDSSDIANDDSDPTAQCDQIEPMSLSQARMWLPYLMLQDKTAYNCTTSYRLIGQLDIPRFERALRSLLQSHQAFRTLFYTDHETGEAMQAIVPTSSTFSLRKVGSANDSSDVKVEHDRVAQHVYELERGDSFIATLVTHRPDYHTVIFGYHHIILDGVSWQIFLQELDRFYADPQRRPSLGVDFLDFSTRQHHDLTSIPSLSKRQFWKMTFASGSLPESLPLFPFAKAPARMPLTQYRVTEYFVELDRSLAAKIRSASTTNQTTAFHFYLSVFSVMMYRMLGVTDLCIGMTDANRNDQAFLETIGLLLDMLPLRFRLDKTPSDESAFADHLRATRDIVYSALGNSGVPLETILQDIGAESSATELPLFQAVVNYRMGAIKHKSIGDLGLEYLSYEDAGHPFDFILTIDEDEGRAGLTLSMQDYLYDRAGANIFLDSYIHLLEFFATTPTERVATPPAFAPALERTAIELGTGPRLSDPWEEPTLVHRIDHMAAKYPSDVALGDERGSLSYKAMSDRVNAIATQLLAVGAQVSTRVAVFGTPSTDNICSLLAILRIGAIYVPCDVRSADERLRTILTESEATVVIVNRETSSRFAKFHPDTVQAVIQLATVPIQSSPVHNAATAAGLAFIMFTSGSTGTPKGIQLTHANFLTHVQAASAYMQLGREVVLQQSAASYDASLAQIFYALANGGRLVVADNLRDTVALASILEKEAVTFTLMAPSEYLLLMEYTGDILARCSEWKVAMCGGEAFPPRLKGDFGRLGHGELSVYNAYGPTEIAVASNIGEVAIPRKEAAGESNDGDESHVPIGSALPEYNVYLVNEDIEPVPLGCPGQIAVAGPAVSAGYLKNEPLTSDKFPLVGERFHPEKSTRVYLTGDLARMLSNGSMVYLGRIESDTQIKLRGIRVELGDIANAILKTSRGVIANAAVGVRNPGPDQFLVAYVVLSGEKGTKRPANVRQYLDQLLVDLPLPQAMKPAVAVDVGSSLPMTSSGKLDMRALNARPLPASGDEDGDEDTETETGADADADAGADTTLSDIHSKLREIWNRALGGHTSIPITPSSNFFAVGGSSLSLLKMQALVQREFDLRIALPELFRTSTFGAIAERILRGVSAGFTEEEVEDTVPSSSPVDIIDWKKETALSETLRSLASSSQSDTRSPPMRRRPLTVILTGATGFLGRAIARALQARDDVLHIHCIAVRNPHSSAALELERTCDKVILHAGDLALPFLGMMEEEARLVFEEADVIVHNGADVSFLKSYQTLRGPNLRATQTLVEMTAHRQVPFHFVSTAGVATTLSEGSSPVIDEISLANHPPPTSRTGDAVLIDGYVASKWASETFLEHVHAQLALPVRIYRPSSITGADAPALDVMHNVLNLSRRMRALPDLGTWTGYFDFIRVETVAEEIAAGVTASPTPTATTPTPSGVEFIHLSGEKLIPVAEARKHLERETGYAFRTLEMAEWCREAAGYGLPALVAGYLESLEGQALSFPRLRSRIAEWGGGGREVVAV
uniref:Polyketide synthase-nonribosomal peptide synthetase hybrid himA n=1 Tax=Aspergillus japonicus TaxID=34381 RepID=HIMA_ASPJA|nr:RecName: Full=Polyketide synthase-nonribosomal peptide synthetase hybrid himA; Short=PKS-NRPS hybrid synthetase himA; AltName: Full=Himeic acid biosynthesis cluster protein A [Aspergillus japonicus]BBA91557.1 polyketide synthase-nonribosomal peptide synthetase [Aspergillus japonicus]